MHESRYRQTTRTLAGALIGAAFVQAIAIAFVLEGLPGGLFAKPPVWTLPAQALAAFIVHLLCERYGYAPAPIKAGTDRKKAANEALGSQQTFMFSRFGGAAAILVVSIAGAMWVTEGGYFTFLPAAVFYVALCTYHVFPREPMIARFESELNREGGISYLSELMGFTMWTGPEEDKPVLITATSADDVVSAR